MNLRKTPSGIFLFNIIPRYRPGMSDVFDYSRGRFGLASLPTSGQRAKQNTLFTSFENEIGVCLADADLLYVFATNGDREYAKINWKNPGDFTPTEVNTPTFTENIGFSGNSINQYLNTLWDAATDGVNFTQDECGAFCYINNDDTDGDIAFGFRGGTTATNGSTHLVPEISGVHQFSISDGGASVGSSASAIGFFHIRRVASNDIRLFKNGSQVGLTETDASTVLSSRDCYILAFNNNGALTNASDAQIGVFGIGASLTGKEAALNTAWNTYFASL